MCSEASLTLRLLSALAVGWLWDKAERSIAQEWLLAQVLTDPQGTASEDPVLQRLDS